jgi:ubiquinone/menaquinone biosynthesis C-methylase UbiE
MPESRAARVQAFYDGFAERYDSARYGSAAQLKVDAAAKDAVLALLRGRQLDGARVLDVGCGTGRFARLFADRGAAVTGIDSSPRMLDIARERVPEATFALDDVLAPALEGHFEVVVCSQVLTHLHEYERPLRNMRSLLAAEGAVVIDARNLAAPRSLAYVVRRRARRGTGDGYDPHFVTRGGLRRAAAAAGLRDAEWRGISAGGTLLSRPAAASLAPTVVVRLEPGSRS